MRFFALGFALLCITGLLLRAQQEGESPPGAPGVAITIESLDKVTPSDKRIGRLVALAVPEGQSPSAFTAPGPFQATFDGYINLKIRGDYTFTVYGSGECEVFIGGERVLHAAGDDLSVASSRRVRLRKGANRITVHYRPPAGRHASLRLYWAEGSKPAQPIAPEVLTHDPTDPALQNSLRLREGRELVAHHRCIQCHAPEPGLNPAMPEMQMDAPSLGEIGQRLRPQWMARWIRDPRAVRADASMPRVFHGADAEQTAADVAAYLADLKPNDPPDTERFIEVERVEGARLFIQLGCVACHTADGAGDVARLPLHEMRAKWMPGAMVDYLLQPQRHFAWTPMPDFKLSAKEARALTAFILSLEPKNPTGSDAELNGADAERGREQLSSSGCLNCHSINLPNRFEAPALSQVTSGTLAAGCLADDDSDRGRAPAFAFDEADRAAIREVLQAAPHSLQYDSPVEFARRQLRQLSCNACHVIDGQPDSWSRLREEIAAMESDLPPAEDLTGDQSRPSLTWTGEKLRTAWIESFLGDDVPYKPRPWLQARMPAFPSRARLLAEGLALEHGVLPQSPDEQPIDEGLADIGRTLMGQEGGFACTTCHAVGSSTATSPFEAHGPNLSHTSERFHKDFYHRWVRDPQRYEPGTRMPQYADSEGKTALRDILDGDATRQFEAIWQYLRQAALAPPADR